MASKSPVIIYFVSKGTLSKVPLSKLTSSTSVPSYKSLDKRVLKKFPMIENNVEIINPHKELHGEYQTHSDKSKAKAVRLYLKTGSLRHVSEVMGISYSTLQSWKYRTSWWGELTKRFQEEADRKLSARMEEVVQKAVEQIEDRIENGDKILDSKTGEVISVPVKMRDLTAATKTLSDRTDILIGRATKDSIAKEQMADKLAKLAKEFANFTKNKSEALDLVEDESGVFQIEDSE